MHLDAACSEADNEGFFQNEGGNGTSVDSQGWPGRCAQLKWNTTNSLKSGWGAVHYE